VLLLEQEEIMMNAAFKRLQDWLKPLVFLSNNPLSLIGVVVVTTAAVLWVFLLPTLFGHGTNNPYLGIPIFLLLPGLFVIGLILIPIGIVLRRRSRRRQGLPVTSIPDLGLNSPELWRLLGFIGVASFVNVIIASQWGYSTVNYMDSAQFCGQTCHTVMQPEYTAYVNSPHADVACAECHIGPGASWFVRSKLAGVRQVFAVALNTYPQPIPSPVENLRPARETCEHCHWPQRFTGDKVMVHTEYSEDANNTASTTVLLLKVGGRAWNGTVGIHGAHLAANTNIEYVSTDGKRQTIPQVIYTDASGKRTIYNATDSKVTPQVLAAGEHRTMDCVDCHNRPTHVFELPERALDEAMTTDHISPRLPFIKKQALAALKADYPDRDAARAQIATKLDTFYRTGYQQVYAQQRKQIENAIAAVQEIYAHNIFPAMKVTWGTYLNNIGHMDSPGCFRCHDGSHTSADGRTIPNDCNTCHELPDLSPKILTDLGIVPGQAPGADPPHANAVH